MNINTKEHFRHIRRILIAVLVLNWLVALVKIIYGFVSKCSSMTADGFHSLSDGASNIISLIGIHFASQPRDSDHPYGHKKYETFFSLGIAGLLCIVSFQVLLEGIRRILKPVIPQIDLAGFIIMVLTMIINILVMNYEYKKGKVLQSDILVSDSKHTKADILTSFSVIITLFAIKSGYYIFDPFATIIISLFIAYSAFQIARESSKVLCDAAAIVDTKRIVDIVLSIKGIGSCHKIRSRGRPDDIHLDLHVQVNPNMHMDEAHKISYAIEEAIKKDIPQVTDVVVHMEPKEKF